MEQVLLSLTVAQAEVLLVVSAAIVVLVLTLWANKSQGLFYRPWFIMLMLSSIVAMALRSLQVRTFWSIPADTLLLAGLATLLFAACTAGIVTDPHQQMRWYRSWLPSALACVITGAGILQWQIPGSLGLPTLLVATRVLLFVGAGLLLAMTAARTMSVARAATLAVSFALAFGPGMFGTEPLLPLPEMTVMLGLFPLAVGLTASRLKLSNVRLILDRVSVYVILVCTLLLAYSLVVLIVQRAIDTHITRVAEFVTLILSSMAALTFVPLRRRLQRAIDVVLYKDYYEFSPTLQRFSQELAMLREEEDVINFLLDALAETLNLTGIAFVALPEGLDTRLLALIEPDDLRGRRDFATPEGKMRVVEGLSSLGPERAQLTGKHPLLADPWPGCAAIVLIGPPSKDLGVALLVIGEKRASSPLRPDDKALLMTVAHQAATALANALLVAGLKTSLAQVQISTSQLVAARAEQQLLLRELVSADERQRAALAHDLHDDALQEVLYLIRHSRLCLDLADSLDEAYPQSARSGAPREDGGKTPKTTLERLREELMQLVERSQVVESKLRALYMGLYPALLGTVGLQAALQDMVEDVRQHSGLNIVYRGSDEAAEQAMLLPSETVLHVYRIAQEALTNVSKHAGSTSAQLTLSLTSHPDSRAKGIQAPTLRLDVEDDGSGLPMPVDYVMLLRQGHLGLAGMRERAERIGGTLELAPGTPAGTRVTLWLPLVNSSVPEKRTMALSVAGHTSRE